MKLDPKKKEKKMGTKRVKGGGRRVKFRTFDFDRKANESEQKASN